MPLIVICAEYLVPLLFETPPEKNIIEPNSRNIIIQLGFIYWYVIVEKDCLKLDIDAEIYSSKFLTLLSEKSEEFKDDADFYWAYGLGLEIGCGYFGKNEIEIKLKAESFIEKACEIDCFFKKMVNGSASNQEIRDHFKDLSVFA